jgi:hypothetical protein
MLSTRGVLSATVHYALSVQGSNPGSMREEAVAWRSTRQGEISSERYRSGMDAGIIPPRIKEKTTVRTATRCIRPFHSRPSTATGIWGRHITRQKNFIGVGISPRMHDIHARMERRFYPARRRNAEKRLVREDANQRCFSAPPMRSTGLSSHLLKNAITRS